MKLSLHEMQNRFRDLMFDSAKGIENPPDDITGLFESGDIPLPDRLAVYRNNVIGSLREVLVNHYPSVTKMVGDEFMAAMATQYVFKNIPQHGCLNTYGHDFPEFIRSFPPAASLPWLADLARIESAMNAAYYAKDAPALKTEELTGLSEEDLINTRLTLHPSAFLIHSDYPINAIRDYALSDGQGDTPSMDETMPTYLLVVRTIFKNQVIPLAAEEFMFLDLCRSKKTLGDALEDTQKEFQGFDFSSFLQKHIHLETFCSLSANRLTEHTKT